MELVRSGFETFGNGALKIEQKDGAAFVNARTLHANIGSKRDFSTWIKERIEKYGFSDGSDYTTEQILSSPESGSSKARPQIMIQYLLSLSMAKELSMIENTEESRKIRLHLIRVEEAWNRPEMVMARAVQFANRQIQNALNEVAELKPKAIVYDRIVDSTGLKLLSEVGKVNGIGPKKIFDLLSNRGIIYKMRGDLVPKESYQNAGYFQTKTRIAYTDLEGVDHSSKQLYVTPKGEMWIAKQLFAEQRGDSERPTEKNHEALEKRVRDCVSDGKPCNENRAEKEGQGLRD